jgi:hypothetical protein
MANKEEIKERIRIMQAWLDGEEVQWFDKEWDTLGGSSAQHAGAAFDFEQYTYRIKPKPREIWALFYPNGSVDTFNSEDRAISFASRSSGELVKCREVLEDE